MAIRNEIPKYYDSDGNAVNVDEELKARATVSYVDQEIAELDQKKIDNPDTAVNYDRALIVEPGQLTVDYKRMDDTNPTSFSIAVRDDEGKLWATDPVQDGQVATKRYVDQSVSIKKHLHLLKIESEAVKIYCQIISQSAEKITSWELFRAELNLKQRVTKESALPVTGYILSGNGFILLHSIFAIKDSPENNGYLYTGFKASTQEVYDSHFYSSGNGLANAVFSDEIEPFL